MHICIVCQIRLNQYSMAVGWNQPAEYMCLFIDSPPGGSCDRHTVAGRIPLSLCSLAASHVTRRPRELFLKSAEVQTDVNISLQQLSMVT